jgi:hypothetical protein
LAELGVPGLVLLLWVALQLGLHVWRGLRMLRPGDNERVILAAGTLTFLAANAVVFATAHQVYGDVFVLLILGWLFGFLIAVLQGADIPLSRQAAELTPALRGYLVAQRAEARREALSAAERSAGDR